MKEIIKKYKNEEITLVWTPHLCMHSGNCIKGLPQVFRKGQSPWIDLSQSDTDSIVAQVEKCPSGALDYIENSK